MEGLERLNRWEAFYRGKRVLVTGHTGFKGAWLSFWLTELGARVSGFAQAPGEPSLFSDLGLESLLDAHLIGDVRDFAAVRNALRQTQPEIVFHLAAQPLVRHSYVEPRATFETNVLGVVNLLEAVRLDGGPRVIQVITSDKCYRNDGTGEAFQETDALGGADPYSASKACAEIAVVAYRESFFREGTSVATARAGNVIGGGDWAEERIIPDCVRAFQAGRPVRLRNPLATRPWQFVLDPLAGYLMLAQRQWHEPTAFSEAWNFGPDAGACLSVHDLVSLAADAWGGGAYFEVAEPSGTGRPRNAQASFHEAPVLTLDAGKANARLGWHTKYGVQEAMTETIRWYRARHRQVSRFNALEYCRRQLWEYPGLTAAPELAAATTSRSIRCKYTKPG
jgi:CDP-glucose 4,6-dehydratase